MTHPGTLHDGGKRTASIVPPPPSPPSPPSPVTPGQEDVLGLRVAAALIDLALLAGLFLIIASTAGLVTAAGGSFSIWLSSAWWAAFAAVAGLYYFVLETVSGQTVGKGLLGVQVCGPGRTRPSARAVAGRTLLRVVDFLPVMYLAGFVTNVAPGVRRRRIGDLAARTAVARAAPVRHRALAVVPLAVVLLAAVGLFGYPAGWQQHSGAASTPAGGTRELWSSAVGPGTPYDLTSFRVSRTVPGAAARATSPPGSSATSTTPPSGSTTPGSSPVNGMPGNGGLGAKVVPAPAGFTLSQSSDVHNGPMNAADFNQYWGDPASLHFVRGYDVTYDSNDASASIEVTLFQFATPADAADFKAGFTPGGPVNSKADAVIPAGDDYDSTAADQGFYDHGVIATKGNLAFVIDDLTGSAAPVPLVERMARQQYAAMAVLGTIPAAPSRASAQTNAERITSYDARITIQRDGSILVTEQVTYDFGADQRHGIFRVIPVQFRYNNGGYDRIYPIEVRSVWSDTPSPEYSVDSNGSSISIKIGNPDQTVTGVHWYQITYLVRGSLNAFADHDELYWNVVGNQWDVPIDQARVRVSAPVAVSRAACFAGPLGSTAACGQAAITNGVASFSQNGLGPREGLTVVVAIPKGVVASPGPILRERWSLQRAFALTPVSAGASGGLLAVLVIIGAVVLARGRDRLYAGPSAGAVAGRPVQADEAVPPPSRGRGQLPMEPAPPDDVRPGQAGTLLDGVANPRDVTATIVDLAVRGYLRIEELPPDAQAMRAPSERPDWRLVRLGKTGGLLDYEQILLDGLFEGAVTDSGAASTRLSELGPAFAGRLKQAQDALYKDLAARGWFTARPDRVRRKWLAIGSVTFVAGVVAVIVAAAGTHHLGLVPIPAALAGLVLIGGARWMPARTAKGTALARRVAGFRRFIRTAAVPQAQPGAQPDTLYDYLPYAIAFGCTQQWADVTAALTGTRRAPSWYLSSQPFSPAALSSLPLSAYYFSSIHHFAANTNNWIASHASSTGGSGFSGFSGGGFSGGGFSGGGGGGGGGGSW